jgi:hypothetical protein
MVNYPSDLPVEAVSSMINMIKTKSIDKSEFGICLWNIQGYAQSKILGESFQVMGSTPLASADQVDDEQMLLALESLQQPKEQVAQFSLVFATILKWCLTKAIEYLL